MKHPPWLRFQAYVVGLPKTGSTSLATIFAKYRTGHEIAMQSLLAAGLPWRAGEIDEARFWELATPRLTRPTLEMDSATCHHLYADLLVERYPRAVFVHSVRDVGGWLTSLLDMAMRYRMARQILDMAYSLEDIDYIALMTEGVFQPYRNPRESDMAAVAPMMRYWAEHMRRITEVLPPERSIMLRTRDLQLRLPDLAGLCGVPVETLRADLTHSNRAPRTLDRLALYRDEPTIREAYDEYCAPIMADLFPEEHARYLEGQVADTDWEDHCDRVLMWVEEAVAEYGDSVGR